MQAKLVVLVISIIVWANQSSGATKLCSELFQANRHQSISILENNDFVVNRSLTDYKEKLGDAFLERLNSLVHGQVWADFGAGERQAAMQYLAKYEKKGAATVYAISYKSPPISWNWADLDARLRQEKRLVVIDGNLIEDIPEERLPVIDIGSDVYGPLSYTDNISLVLNKYLSMLHKPMESSIFGVVRSLNKDATVFDIMGMTVVITRKGQALLLPQWLMTQPQIVVRLSGEPKEEQNFEITKAVPDAKVEDLELVDLQYYSQPPLRIFRERGSKFSPSTATLVDSRDGKRKTVAEILKEAVQEFHP
jgi:hypothetical protein